jgi:hypothetical protein
MESLKELVAASFARHGIECPAGDSQWVRPTQPKQVQMIPPAEPALTAALPEHNYRKRLQGDPAP